MPQDLRSDTNDTSTGQHDSDDRQRGNDAHRNPFSDANTSLAPSARGDIEAKARSIENRDEKRVLPASQDKCEQLERRCNDADDQLPALVMARGVLNLIDANE